MKLKQRKEADVKKAVADYLKMRRVRFWRMNSGMLPMAYKGKSRFIHLCEPGTPDFLVLKPGYWTRSEPECSTAIWLEVKRPLGPKGGTGGSEQSPEQIAFEEEAKRNGERYHVVRSIDDLVRALA